MSRKSTKKRVYRKRRKKKNRSPLIIAALLLVIAVAALLIRLGVIEPEFGPFSAYKRPAAADAATSVRFIDVGQGDCTLAVSDGQALLIDSGESDSRDTVISYIRALGIGRLDCIIITHPHSDHMGEMADIIDSFEVGRVIMPKLPARLVPTGYSYERLLKAIDKNGVPLEAADNSSFSLGGFKVETFIPREYTENLNNCSVVTKLTHGSNSFLITGDCETEEESDLLSQGFDLSADVLKVGHHGSSTSNSALFLAAVRPSYAVISCSADNDYGHPSEKTLIALKAFARETYITRDDGTVVFVSDGEGLTAYTN